MFVKGDYVLITDPSHKWAGFTGTVKKIDLKDCRLIVGLAQNKADIWIYILYSLYHFWRV